MEDKEEKLLQLAGLRLGNDLKQLFFACTLEGKEPRVAQIGAFAWKLPLGSSGK